MPLPLRRMRWLAMVALLGLLWVSPAAATSFTATWNVVPNTPPPPAPPPPSPFYDCPTWGGGGLICNWLWDQGLEVSDTSPFLPMYGDSGPFFDAFGDDQLPLESEVTAFSSLLQIVPKCLAGIDPCFDTFTPLSMVAEGYFSWTQGGVFFVSSNGGLLTTSNGLANFSGPEWTNITWMGIGLFLPDACGDPESDCVSEEQALYIHRLTFDATAVPEPASTLLVGTGLLALLRRYRRR